MLKFALGVQISVYPSPPLCKRSHCWPIERAKSLSAVPAASRRATSGRSYLSGGGQNPEGAKKVPAVWRYTPTAGTLKKRTGNVLLSRTRLCSIIAAEALNRRVRDGYGCYLLAMITSSKVRTQEGVGSFDGSHVRHSCFFAGVCVFTLTRR